MLKTAYKMTQLKNNQALSYSHELAPGTVIRLQSVTFSVGFAHIGTKRSGLFFLVQMIYLSIYLISMAQ